MGKSRQEKRSDARKIAKALVSDPRAVAQFAHERVPPAEQKVPVEPPMSPEEKKLVKFYSTIATNVWRMKNQILDTETNEPKDGLDGRVVAKLARYLSSLDGALEDAGVRVIGDYNGKPHDEGNAVKVISYEDRADLKRDEYIETLLPTVRWTNENGDTRLLQQAEVVVGRPAAAGNNGQI